MIAKYLNPRTIGIAFLLLVAIGAVYGFAAANVVPVSGAGQGSSVTTGYTVTNVVYTLDAANAHELDAVSFDVAANGGGPAADTVKVQLDASSNTWYNCAAGTPPNWSCTITDTLLVADMDVLDVVVVGNLPD